MAVITAKDFKEVYRAKARSRDIRELSGRSDKQLTEFVNSEILTKLDINSRMSVLDVGCGDGSLLSKIPAAKRFGVVPSIQEAVRLKNSYKGKPNLHFCVSESSFLPFKGESFHTTICNGVLLILRSESEAMESIRELGRCTLPKGQIWLGEIATADELRTKRENYGSSTFRFLVFLFRKRRYKALLYWAIRLALSYMGFSDFIVQPNSHLVLKGETLVKNFTEIGMTIIWTGKHRHRDRNGQITTVESRTNYLLSKVGFS